MNLISPQASRFASVMMKRFLTTRKHAGSGGNNTIPRILRQGLPYYFRRDGYANFPMTIFFTINGRCNMRCRMCDIGEKNQESMFYHNLSGENQGDFPIERFKTLMDEVASHKPFIAITTTEALLYKPIWEAVSYAQFRGMDTNITTNGIRVEKFVDEIMESGLYRLSVSIDGPPDLHDKMRRLPGATEKILNGLQLVAERKRSLGSPFPKITINSFIADTNHQRLVEMVENLPLDIVDVVNIKLMVFHTQGMVELHNAEYSDRYPATTTCFPDDFSADNLNLDVLYEQTQEIKEKYGDKVQLHFEPDKKLFQKYFYSPTEFMDASNCVLPWFVAQLTNDGDLAVYTRCFDVRLGNILDRPFEEVWNGEEMRKFRIELKDKGRFPVCSRCDGVLFR